MAQSILIIEDSRLERRILENIVGVYFPDCRIDTVGDSLLAESMARKHEYQFITVDVNIPGIDGLSLIPELQKKCPDARIAVISASANSDEMLAEVERLQVSYIPKPVKEADLVAFLRGEGK